MLTGDLDCPGMTAATLRRHAVVRRQRLYYRFLNGIFFPLRILVYGKHAGVVTWLVN